MPDALHPKSPFWKDRRFREASALVSEALAGSHVHCGYEVECTHLGEEFLGAVVGDSGGAGPNLYRGCFLLPLWLFHHFSLL